MTEYCEYAAWHIVCVRWWELSAACCVNVHVGVSRRQHVPA